MHIVFAVSSVLLLGVTVWMMAADHAEEWHDHISKFEEIRLKKIARKVNHLKGGEYNRKLELLEDRIQAANKILSKNQAAWDEKKAILKNSDFELRQAQLTLKNQRAARNVARAKLGIIGIRDHADEKTLNELKAAFDKEQLKVDEQTRVVEEKETIRNAANDDLKEFTKIRDDVQAKLKKLNKTLSQLHTIKIKLKPDNIFARWKRRIMEWDIIDGFNSHYTLKDKLDWTPDLPIQLGNAKRGRNDTCRACHLGIAQLGAGNVPDYPLGHTTSDDVDSWVEKNRFPNPYATHPKPDLYLSASSPHPLPKFGCTICHDGNGSGTKFQNASHTPNNPHIAGDWHEQYGYAPNHFWEYPMLPKRFQESGCVKCHHQIEELGVNPKFGPTAPKLFEGYRLVQKYGCFGCHEIHGFEKNKSIGPDLRLEPSYAATAQQLLQDRIFKQSDRRTTASGISLSEMKVLAEGMIDHPENSSVERKRLTALIKTDVKERKKAELELLKKNLSKSALSQAKRDLADNYLAHETARYPQILKDSAHAGKYRKRGPSLRHVGSKTTQVWIREWVNLPSKFRPATRMPQFFNLSNQDDETAKKFKEIELAGIAQYLVEKSQPIVFDNPGQVKVDAAMVKRGKEQFVQRGCVACHKHAEVPGAPSDFGPDLSRLKSKIKPDAKNPNFSTWLYTWIRDPHRHHKRTRMPNLYVFPQDYAEMIVGKGTDPAADITAFLLAKDYGNSNGQLPRDDRSFRPNGKHLDELVDLYLTKIVKEEVRGDWRKKEKYYADGLFPIKDKNRIKGDEIELFTADSKEPLDPDEFLHKKLNFIGRRTISRYGCYACHDIPGFEMARPIGTTLQDWGRKDITKLAPEHIRQYLRHHGEPDGSSTFDRVKRTVNRSIDSYENETVKDKELSAAYFYDNLLHHDRAGFLWQKLRDPRSYDYKKIETEGYDERLKMHKFPLNEKEIESIATFILGLVAEPPPAQYVYTPKGADFARVEGERLLNKFNCTSCHLVELPRIEIWADLTKSPFKKPTKPQTLPMGYELLNRFKPPRKVNLSRTRVGTDEDDEKVNQTLIDFRGLKVFDPDEDPAEEDNTTYSVWEQLEVNGTRLLPGTRTLRVNDLNRESEHPGRGGEFAEFLFRYLKHTTPGLVDPAKSDLARQGVPPNLHQEGLKVQTPWLYHFLKDPIQLRHTTVLRMPRFNMSDSEARSLANYFAAVDGVAFPYQEIPQRSQLYLNEKNSLFPDKGRPNGDYLSQSWRLLNNPKLCLNCHSVGGLEVKTASKKDIRGPNLDYVVDRLRPDWVLLWLYQPKWITPYTAMPKLFNEALPANLDSFDGKAQVQTKAVRDALLNYHRLMEQHKNTRFSYPTTGTGSN